MDFPSKRSRSPKNKRLKEQVASLREELEQKRFEVRYMRSLIEGYLEAFDKLQQIAKAEVAEMRDFPEGINRRLQSSASQSDPNRDD